MAILLNVIDPDGNRITAPARPTEQNLAFTARVKDRMSTMLDPWGPEDIASALRDAESGDLTMQSELFEQMEEKDGALFGFMQTRRLAPAGLKWVVDPKNDTPRAKRAARIAEEGLRQIPGFRWFLIDCADAIGKGISAIAPIWTPQADIIGMQHINPRRYRFHSKTNEFMIVPYADPDKPQLESEDQWIKPEPYQVIIHRSKTRTSHPARGGVLRVAVWAFLLRNYTYKDWVTFSEVFGMPLRIAKYPIGATETEKEALLEAVRLLGTDAAAIISEQTEIELREAVNRGNQPYSALADAMRSELALAILGQELTNTVGPNGARAQAQVQNEVRHDLLAADCEDLQETIRQQIIFPMIGWKLGWETAEEFCPAFKFEYETAVDYQVQSSVDKTILIDCGLGKHVTVGWLAARYGVQLAEGVDPETRVTEELSAALPPARSQTLLPQPNQPQQKQLPPMPTSEQMRGAMQRRVRQGQTRQNQFEEDEMGAQEAQEAVDKFTDQILRKQAQEAFNKLLAPVREIIETSTSLEEIEHRLELAYQDLPIADFEELIGSAMYAARLYGRYVASDEIVQ